MLPARSVMALGGWCPSSALDALLRDSSFAETTFPPLAPSCLARLPCPSPESPFLPLHLLSYDGLPWRFFFPGSVSADGTISSVRQLFSVASPCLLISLLVTMFLTFMMCLTTAPTSTSVACFAVFLHAHVDSRSPSSCLPLLSRPTYGRPPPGSLLSYSPPSSHSPAHRLFNRPSHSLSPRYRFPPSNYISRSYSPAYRPRLSNHLSNRSSNRSSNHETDIP